MLLMMMTMKGRESKADRGHGRERGGYGSPPAGKKKKLGANRLSAWGRIPLLTSNGDVVFVFCIIYFSFSMKNLVFLQSER